tara:strand:+ start:3298 stop:4812 length:1515 start_codon:yes stop_codon:yes gene_type:complete
VRPTKSSIKVVLISSFLAINFVVIYLLAQAYGFFNSGAERATMLNLTAPETSVYQPGFSWVNIDNPSRSLDKSAQKALEIDYLNAWHARQLALYSNDLKFLEDHYTDEGLVTMQAVLEHNAAQNIQIESTTLSHELDLEFYSEDGQIAVLTDHHVEEVQYIYQDELLKAHSDEVTSYEIIMMLKDGRWRIRHLARQVASSQDTLERPGTARMPQSQLKGVNYYPQDSPWDTFGQNFNVETLADDLAIIKDLDLNTIRIFVGFEDFGKEYLIPEKVEKLKQLLDTAQQADIKVIVTLFDFYGDYSVFDWPASVKHATALVTRFKDHPAVLAWDIKNEPDLDFASRGKERVLGWLHTMIKTVRSIDRDALVTIGWSNAGAAPLLQEEVDLVSFHYYGKVEGYQKTFQALKNKVDKPLMLQEFGLSTYRGLWSPFGNSQNAQREFYAHMLEVLTWEDTHFTFWTLYDFKDVPTGVVGRLPWRKKPQTAFGILDVQGEKKAAYNVFKK